MSSIILMNMMMANNSRMAAERRRRRRREEEERQRKRRQEEEERRRREEEERQRRNKEIAEYRRNAPLEYNDEDWQHERCLKAISLQPCVQGFLSAIEAVKPIVIEEVRQKYNSKIIAVGYEYENVRQKLEQDLATLKETGITITGDRYRLTRLSPTDSNLAKPEQVTEYLGDTFTLRDSVSIKIDPTILADKSYYDKLYLATKPDRIENEYQRIDTQMKKYQRFGKYFGFLLKTKKYLDLEEQLSNITPMREKCEQRKKEMQTYRALTKKQLLAIKSYFEHLDELSSIGSRIEKLFDERYYASDRTSYDIYDLTIKKIMSMEEYSKLAAQVHDYISKICSNDEETMDSAYELVKGEYPVEIPREFIYNLIISDMKVYYKEDTKELKHTNS